MERSSSKIKKFLIFQENFLFYRRELVKPEKQTKTICSEEISYIFLEKLSPLFFITNNLLLYPLLLSYSFFAMALLIPHPIVDI